MWIINDLPRSPSGDAVIFNLEFVMTLIVGGMCIPAIALLVLASSTMQVTPDHMRR